MKNKGLMLGVLLIIGIFLMSPVSAAKVIDNSAKIFYSEKYDCNVKFTWTTYMYNKNHVRTYMNAYYPDLGNKRYKGIMDITSKNSIIKVKSTITWNGKTSVSNDKFKLKGFNALRFYDWVLKYEIRNR